MGFVKVIKNKAYFKRYQTKFRRRRECKTDYYARKRLVTNDKNKYKAPKNRFVVRFTNRDVICQIFAAELTKDRCLASAYSHELKRYGISFGLTNYAAAYCTGLLLARRVNTKYKLDYDREEDEEADGDYFNVEDDWEAENEGHQKHREREARPFKAYLDIGLKRPTTGARVFGALKGLADGGIAIPHSERRFPGTTKVDGEVEADPEAHARLIFGGHVAEYMEMLSAKSKDAYQKQFSCYIKLGITADSIQDAYKAAHVAIRKDPNMKRGALERGYFKARAKAVPSDYKPKMVKSNAKKLTIQQRKARIKAKLTAAGIKSLKE